jgi:hypothetical protein
VAQTRLLCRENEVKRENRATLSRNSPSTAPGAASGQMGFLPSPTITPTSLSPNTSELECQLFPDAKPDPSHQTSLWTISIFPTSRIFGSVLYESDAKVTRARLINLRK